MPATTTTTTTWGPLSPNTPGITNPPPVGNQTPPPPPSSGDNFTQTSGAGGTATIATFTSSNISSNSIEQDTSIPHQTNVPRGSRTVPIGAYACNKSIEALNSLNGIFSNEELLKTLDGLIEQTANKWSESYQPYARASALLNAGLHGKYIDTPASIKKNRARLEEFTWKDQSKQDAGRSEMYIKLVEKARTYNSKLNENDVIEVLTTLYENIGKKVEASRAKIVGATPLIKTKNNQEYSFKDIMKVAINPAPKGKDEILLNGLNLSIGLDNITSSLLSPKTKEDLSKGTKEALKENSKDLNTFIDKLSDPANTNNWEQIKADLIKENKKLYNEKISSLLEEANQAGLSLQAFIDKNPTKKDALNQFILTSLKISLINSAMDFTENIFEPNPSFTLALTPTPEEQKANKDVQELNGYIKELEENYQETIGNPFGEFLQNEVFSKVLNFNVSLDYAINFQDSIVNKSIFDFTTLKVGQVVTERTQKAIDKQRIKGQNDDGSEEDDTSVPKNDLTPSTLTAMVLKQCEISYKELIGYNDKGAKRFGEIVKGATEGIGGGNRPE